MLAGAGIWAQRLDDPDLVRLFHSCWSRGQSARFDQDLGYLPAGTPRRRRLMPLLRLEATRNGTRRAPA